VRRARAILAGAALAAAAALAAPSARAVPTLWARARDPGIDVRASLIAEADAMLLRYDRLRRSPLQERVEEIGPLWLREARSLYERAGAATSPDVGLRLKYAGVLEDLGDYPVVAALLEDLLGVDGSAREGGRRPRGPAAEPAAPFRAEAWRELAICYARLGKHREEIKAYAEALALEPHSGTRAVLLANRAEAYMVLGDIASAVDGYRASLATLSSREMFRYGVTTLWGLGVALDRSGDLDGAFESIQLARSYDRTDLSIHGPGWFYVPPYDEAWYEALGHWAAARAAELGAARMESYAQAIASWEEYIQRAPEADSWLPLAKARLERCEKERDQARQRRAAPARGKPAR
jgi:tetratricopeptide (TPR) repeat protein